MPQWPLIGWPSQAGHSSLAAWLQTVKTKSSGGASGPGGEAVACVVAQDRLGEDRAGGIAGADEQHVEFSVGHGGLFSGAG